jgi:NAD(P)-dependent dehydrogenase (short-subunit alcohol dehydrogenase family)
MITAPSALAQPLINMSPPNTPFDPARKAALATGAGNGIGYAIAQALVGEGVRSRETAAGEKVTAVLRVARISLRFGHSHLAGDGV